MKSASCVLRQEYPELGIDLTSYSGKLAGKYGSAQPPLNIRDAFDDHLIRQVTEASSFEEIRDLLHNGYGISSCGSEGLAKVRDENGVSKRSGSWAHAMAYIGVDDREETKRKYGGPLILDLNSWNVWNSGPREIYKSSQYVPEQYKTYWQSIGIVASSGNILLPEGATWVRWSDFKNRYASARASVNGWPRQNLPQLYSSVLG